MHLEEGYVATPAGARLHYRRTGAGPTIVIPNGDHLLDPFAALARRYTLLIYDPRNRGRSDTITDPAKLLGGVRNDVDDLDCVRRHFALASFGLIAHSYVGHIAGLYAMDHARHVERMVLIGPMPPCASKHYPPDLKYDDGVVAKVLAALHQLQRQMGSVVDLERCRRSWELLSQIYVTDPRNAARTQWGRCELANERNFMSYWTQHLMPSIQAAHPTPAQFAAVTAEVLVVHGRKDRSGPYGGGRDWALNLPKARILTVPEGGHAPWIEAPQVVAAVGTFLGGAWPDGAVRVSEQ
jgi:proline iminopeptidase